MAGLANRMGFCFPKGNVGFITLLNYGQERPLRETVLTLAHELGHSLGAVHDEDKGCGSNFIMTSTTSSSDLLQQSEFSSCSLSDIKANLDLVTGAPSFNCLQGGDMLPLVVSQLSQGPLWHPHSFYTYIAIVVVFLV